MPQKPGAAGSTDGCKYTFDPAKAAELLTSHGWKVTPDGTTTEAVSPNLPDWHAAMDAARALLPEGARLIAWYRDA